MISLFFSVIIILLDNHVLAYNGMGDSQIFLSVYYSSACPFSRNFIVNQLQPAAELLNERIILQLLPFGHSKSIDFGYSGFECKHGPDECLANMIQDCTLYKMITRSVADRVSYVACEMKTMAAMRGDLSCVDAASVSPDAVQECVKSGEGTSLQLDSERLSREYALKPTPVVVFEWKYVDELQSSASRDLTSTLCSMMHQNDVCADHYNTIALNEIFRRKHFRSFDNKISQSTVYL